MSTINIVKYFFYKGTMPKNEKLLSSMVALAYQSARDQKLYPKAILIRWAFPPISFQLPLLTTHQLQLPRHHQHGRQTR